MQPKPRQGVKNYAPQYAPSPASKTHANPPGITPVADKPMVGFSVAAETNAFRSIGGSGQAFDTAKLGRIQAALERQGASFVTGEEGGRMARALGGEAVYFPAEVGRPGIFAFGPNPTRTQVIEELMHYGQHKALGFGSVSGKIVGLEIQAQSRLLQVGPRLGWTAEEMAQIQRAQTYWKGQ